MKPISIVIITYNRPVEALELLQNITTLEGTQELLEDVIILNNASTADYQEVKAFAKNYTAINFRFIEAPANLGVAKGRNYACKYTNAPILILLDDDAELGTPAALANTIKAFDQYSNPERPVAIITFKVLYHSTMQMQVNAFPHKQYNKYKDEHFLYTYYYAGGAHAIRKDVLEIAGNYPEDFFYGMEEYDMSYRILDKGYSIVYSDSIVMLHKESPLGRTTKKEKQRMMWVNKSKVALRYLPGKYFTSTAIMWSLEYLKKTGGDIKGFLKGWKEIFQMPATEKRTPVSKKTLEYLKKTEARLWY